MCGVRRRRRIHLEFCGSTGTVMPVVVQDVEGFGGGDSEEELEGWGDREHLCQWSYLST
jgi:hypothetical protein